MDEMRNENEEVMNTSNECEETIDSEKFERFQEESKDRMNKICQQIHFLEKIAGKRTVDYSKANVEKMFAYLEKELAECKDTFMARFEETNTKKDFDFDF